MKKLAIISVIAGVAATSSATIINIPAEYPTIQQGINASVDGDTVLVQPGTYVENIHFNGHNVVLGSLFLTTGDTSYITQTIIDGNHDGEVVTFWENLDETLAITGFTIQNGFEWDGAGIYCYNSNPVIKYNIIRDNSTDGDENPSYGAGICCLVSNPLISNNLITGNEARNRTFGHGGAIGLLGSDAIIENNTIYGNFAEGEGGGIYGIGPYNPILINNILWNNSSVFSYSNEIYFESGSSPLITYCNIQDTLCPGPGNMSVPPLFRDTINGDFHLMSTSCGDLYDSPCIDAGDPNILDSTFDCSWGLGVARSDMGAYGGTGDLPDLCQYATGDANYSGEFDGLDVVYGVVYFTGGQPPPYECECPPGNVWYVAGDVNSSCNYNGLDITYAVAYLKGGPAPEPCAECPPSN